MATASQVRSFLHVADAVRAILDLMASPAAVAGVFNIGGDEPVTLLELAQRVGAAVQPGAAIELRPYPDTLGAAFRGRPPAGSRPDPAPLDDRLSARVRSGRHAAGDHQLHPGDAAEVVVAPRGAKAGRIATFAPADLLKWRLCILRNAFQPRAMICRTRTRRASEGRTMMPPRLRFG